MKSLNIVLLFVFCLSIVFNSEAQKRKVLDKSSRKPKWVNAIVKDHIIVVGSGDEINIAKESALAAVKKRVVTSVAQNIKSESTLVKGEDLVNSVSTYFENYSAKVKSKSADLDFIKGISLNKVKEFYWEKVRMGRRGAPIKYYYHIKYPFSEAELNKLVKQFEFEQKKLEMQLDELTFKLGNFQTLEELLATKSQLESLKDVFIDSKKTRVEAAINSVRAIVKSIRIDVESIDNEQLTYKLMLKDKVIRVGKTPTVKSNCAQILSKKKMDDTWVIKFDSEGCYEDDVNFIKIIHRVGGLKIEDKIGLDLKSEIIKFTVDGAINLKENGSEGFKGHLVINSKFDSKYTITKLVLELDKEVEIDLDYAVTKKGVHKLKFNTEESIDKIKASSKDKSIPQINGKIYYKNKKGETYTYRIYKNKYKTNW